MPGRLALLLLAAGTLPAQNQIAPPNQMSANQMKTGFVRGAMAAWEGDASAGQLSVRTADGSVSSCGYDSRSWIERGQERIAVSTLVAGDRVEVLADRAYGSSDCYARVVYVIDPQPSARLRATVAKPPEPPASVLRSNGTIAGLVIRHEGRTFTIKTRGSECTLVVRPETSFRANGLPVEAADLGVNTRVFVRGGWTMDGKVQALQVMWGSILNGPGN